MSGTSSSECAPGWKPQDSTKSPGFSPTQWTVVLQAARNDTAGAFFALSKLCEVYWYPLYAYVRRRGYSPADAQDLTQSFFASLLRRDAIAEVSPSKGKFRAFLLASLNHFLADEWDKARAQKRGEGRVIGLDLASAETRFAHLGCSKLSPDKLFERQWALTLLEEVYQRLSREYQQKDKAALFDALRFSLTTAKSAVAYAEIAQLLGMSEGAVKVAAHRLRQRYRQLLREQIAETVSAPEEVEAELRYLFQVLAR